MSSDTGRCQEPVCRPGKWFSPLPWKEVRIRPGQVAAACQE
jgi:hypothetical protein